MNRATGPIGVLLLLVAQPPRAHGQEPYPYDANCSAWPVVEGPYAVGTTEFAVTDWLRGTEYAPTPTDYRRLYVRAWYPADRPDAPSTTDAASGAPPARRPYFTPVEMTTLASGLMTALGQPDDALRNCAALATNSYEDAAPAEGRFPLVGYNHGYTSYPAQQTALFEHLAANGYVIVSVGHPYESGGLAYPDGDVLKMSPRITQDLQRYGGDLAALTVHYPPDLATALDALPGYFRRLRATSLGRLAPVWRDDVLFVVDRLEDEDVPAKVAALAAATDHDARAYMGMSYGGYIAAMLAQTDLRAKAAVNLDGGYWTAELVDADARTPLLMLNSDPTQVLAGLPPALADAPVYRGEYGPDAPTAGDLAYERLARAGLRPDVHRIMVPGIQHIAVSDLSELVGAPGAAPFLGDPEVVERFTVMQNDLVLGFLDRYLKGDDSAYPAAGFPAQVLSTHPHLLVRDKDDIRRQAEALGLAGGSRPR